MMTRPPQGDLRMGADELPDQHPARRGDRYRAPLAPIEMGWPGFSQHTTHHSGVGSVSPATGGRWVRANGLVPPVIVTHPWCPSG